MARAAKVRILHRDKHLVIVHKPSGMMVYSDSKEDRAPSCYDHVKKMMGEGAQLFPVHRIDQIHYSRHLKALRCAAVTTRKSDHRMVVADFLPSS